MHRCSSRSPRIELRMKLHTRSASRLRRRPLRRRLHSARRPNNCACSAAPASTRRLVASSITLETRARNSLALQARRQRIEEFDHQRARIAHEGPARPEQPGIERHRQAGARRNRHRSGRRRSCSRGGAPTGLRVPSGKMTAGGRARTSSPARRAISHQRRGRRLAIDADHLGLDQVPAEQRNPASIRA